MVVTPSSKQSVASTAVLGVFVRVQELGVGQEDIDDAVAVVATTKEAVLAD